LSPQIIPHRRHAKPIVLILLLSAVLFTATGFSRSPADDDHHGERDESSAAIERFWKVYHGNEYDQIPQVQQELQNAVEHDPENSTLYALLGATHFWQIGEYTRDPHPDLSVLQQDFPAAVSLFGKALDIDYYSKHLMAMSMTTICLDIWESRRCILVSGIWTRIRLRREIRYLTWRHTSSQSSTTLIVGLRTIPIRKTATPTRKHSIRCGRPWMRVRELGSIDLIPI
jgi:hypothetical protein